MRVGIVGLGIMGSAMTLRLLAAGQEVFVTNRTPEKADPLRERGAQWQPSPAEVASRSEVVFSMVADPAAVAQITLGPDGILAALPDGSVHSDMSTVAPADAARMADCYRQAGKRFVQAPVLGSKRQIEAGELLVLAGGAAEDIALCEPAWDAFAGRTWRFAQPAEAATAKLSCNMLIAHLILGLGQSLLLAQAGGVAPATLLDILDNSAMGCAMFRSKGEKILARDFEANFFVRHMLKDLTLAAGAGQAAGSPLPFNAQARELFIAASRLGCGDEDYSAVVKVLETLADQTLG